VASLVCPLYLADHITSTFAYKNLSVVFVPEYSHDNSCHSCLGWMHNMWICLVLPCGHKYTHNLEEGSAV
jgi:hypothetical protein